MTRSPRRRPNVACARALENGELRLYYQPIVSLWTKRLVGVEALLRWNEPSRGLVDPDEFMGALEDTGLIVPIGALGRSRRWPARPRSWHDAFPDRPTLTVKVNVSERQLGQANFVSQLRDSLARYRRRSERALPRDRRGRAACTSPTPSRRR